MVLAAVDVVYGQLTRRARIVQRAVGNTASLNNGSVLIRRGGDGRRIVQALYIDSDPCLAEGAVGEANGIDEILMNLVAGR